MNLAEEYVLLALHDEKGKVHFNASMSFSYALAGAILSELAACGGIDYKDKKVIIHDVFECGDPIIRQVHTFMNRKNKTRNIKYWVYQLGSYVQRHKLQQVYCNRLVEAGFLKKVEQKVLFFKHTIYPTAFPEIKEVIRDRLRLTVRHKELEDERDMILLSLLHASKLDFTLFSKEEYMQRRKEIKAIVNDPFIMGKYVSAVVTEIQTAVMASVVAVGAAAAASSSSSSS